MLGSELGGTPVRALERCPLLYGAADRTVLGTELGGTRTGAIVVPVWRELGTLTVCTQFEGD